MHLRLVCLALVAWRGTCNRLSTTGSCTLSTSGDCVSSPNYPSAYDSTDCTITNNQAGYLTATFQTGTDHASLNIRRRGLGSYSGRQRGTSTIHNVYLGAGEQIDWTASGYTVTTGWQLCNSAIWEYETASETPRRETAQQLQARCCSPGVQCREYTGACGPFQIATDCWHTDGVCYTCWHTDRDCWHTDQQSTADGCCEGDQGKMGLLIGGVVGGICLLCFICVGCTWFWRVGKDKCMQRDNAGGNTVAPAQVQSVSQPIAPPIMHQPIQVAQPMPVQPLAQPGMKQAAPPMAPQQPGQPGVAWTATPPPDQAQAQAQGALRALPAFCGTCGTQNSSHQNTFCVSCGNQFRSST